MSNTEENVRQRVNKTYSCREEKPALTSTAHRIMENGSSTKLNKDSGECKWNAQKFGLFIGHYVKVLLISIGIIYVTGIIAISLSKDLRKQLVFLNWFRIPLSANLSVPENNGLLNTENLYLTGEQGKLGVWFSKPVINQENLNSPVYFLYLHGNSGSRAVPHRVALYKKLQERGNYVLAIDYRGYGDSDGVPSEEGLISDALVGWKWLTERSGGHPVYIWGHSLGTGVAVGLAKKLSTEESGLVPNGVILEAPFSCVRDAAIEHPFTLPVRFLPPNWLYLLLQEEGNMFRSDLRIKDVSSPMLIVHDKSDNIIPFHLAERLCDTAKVNTKRKVTCEILDEKLYHRLIYMSENFFRSLTNFLDSTRGEEMET